MHASILQPYSRPHSLCNMVCSSHSVVIGIIQLENEPRVKDAVEKYANVKGNCRVKMEGVVKDVVRYLRPRTFVPQPRHRHYVMAARLGA
jgi:hypothetical protein